MAMRFAAVFFLVVLLLGILGLIFGYLSLDVTAPLDRQLTAAGSFAYWHDCEYYGDCEEIYEESEERWTFYGGDEELPSDVVEEELWWDKGLSPSSWDERDEIDFIDEWREWEEWEEWEEWDSWRAPHDDKSSWEEEWIEDEYWFEEQRSVQNPWYVSAFPGIGQIVQQIIPGQNAYAPHPVPPPLPRRVYPQPSCWIAAQPMSVAYGNASTITWAAFNATRASLTDYGTMPLSGSRVINNIRNDRTYQLSVTGLGGSGSCYTRITLRPQGENPSCVIAAHPSAILAGESSSLAWGSELASSAYLSGVGIVSLEGGMYVTPRHTTTYTLTIFGSEGASSACTTQVRVLP